MGEVIHGELVNDGNATTPAVLVLYTSGSATARTLASTEVLHITGVYISSETGGDYALIAGATAAAGKYILFGSLAATGIVVREYTQPFTCPPGVVPYFTGAGSNRNVCLIEGYITSA